MANAAAIGYLELNIKGFEQALTAAKRALTVFAAGMAAMKGMEFLKDGVKDAINFGNAMHHASQAAGRMDPGSFFIIQKAMENIGMSAEGAQAAIKDFVETGRPIQSIFGNSGNYAKALENATQQYGAQAKVLSENASKFSKVFELIQAVGGKIREFFLAMSAQFLKPLQALLETLNRIDLAKIGAEFGKKVEDAINMLNGIVSGAVSWSEIMTSAAEVVVNVLSAGISRLFSLVELLTGSIFISIGGALDALNIEAIALKFANAFVNALKDGLTSVFGGKEFVAMLGQVKNAVSGKKETEPIFDAGKLKENLGYAFSAIKDETSSLFKDMKAENPELVSSFKTLTEKLEKARTAGESLSKSAPDKLGGYAGMKADPYSVIADSLAKVGGGGGAMRVGMSIEEKQLATQNNMFKEQVRTNLLLSQPKMGRTDLVNLSAGTGTV